MSNKKPTSSSPPGAPPQPFQPANLWLTTLGLCLATFMQVLDTTIANVSLPTIAGNLGVSSSQSTWIITSFAVSNAITLPLTGFLSRRFGEVRLFNICTVLFVITSFLCGISTNMTELIVFRALQGGVAGPMYPITQSLLISIYPAAKRGMALSLLSMVTVVAPVAGPILGGWITSSYSWEWIFFINVPVGLLASFIVFVQMRARPVTTIKSGVDYMGLILLVIAVGSLQVVLDLGNEKDWFGSDFIVILTIIAVIGTIAFLIWELTHPDPIVNLTLFRHRNFAFGTIALVFGYSAFFAIGLLVPLWLQRTLNYDSMWSGIVSAPIGILPVFLAPIVGKYANRVDLRLLAALSFVVMSFTSFWRADFVTELDYMHIAMTQLVLGLGVAFFFMPVLTILLSDLRPDEIAAGSGLAAFLRVLGGSFSASITTFLWDHRAVIHHAQLAENISVYNPTAVEALKQYGETTEIAAYNINNLITQQAQQISFNEVFYGLGWLFIVLVGLVWLTRPPFMAKPGAASGAH